MSQVGPIKIMRDPPFVSLSCIWS